MSHDGGSRRRAIICGLCIGCFALTGCRAAKPALPNLPLPKGIVDVVGEIPQPQSIEIPPQGITLEQILLRTGAIGMAEDPGDPLFVALQRGHGFGSEIYYVRLASAKADLAREITLSGRDTVRIVKLSQTSLFNLSADKGKKFTVRGLVQKPGLKETNDIAEGAGALQTIEHLSTVVGEKRVGDQEAQLVILSRPSSSGAMTEHFLLPLPLGKPPVSAAPIGNGDDYEYTQWARVPIILASLVGSTIREAHAEAQSRMTATTPHGCKCCSKLHKKQFKPVSGAVKAVRRAPSSLDVPLP